MNADDLKKLTTDSLDRLAALLDAGQSDRLTAFLKAMGRFHHYSFHNVCLIASQRPDGDARRGVQCLALAQSVRPQGREGHRDPGADRHATSRER